MLNGERFNFLTIPIDLGGCTTQVDIVRRVGRGLRKALGSKETLKKAASSIWEWITNWEILGVKYNKNSDQYNVEDICDELVHKLSKLCSSGVPEIDGILLLIDEADRAPAEAGLGEFLKLLTERLTKDECKNVIVGLAGLPSLLNKLRESHESAPRLFHTALLEPLTVEERERVVRIGLSVANTKNATKTRISDSALGRLVDLSEGYPHFLQQFSYCAFEKDSDGYIDVDDVENGAFGEGGALAQLGDKFFNEMYHARISSEEYRRVLDSMAPHGDEWIQRQTIIRESGVTEANVNNALQALKNKQIIIQDETCKGFYRLPTRSFAAWINAIRSIRGRTP